MVLARRPRPVSFGVPEVEVAEAEEIAVGRVRGSRPGARPARPRPHRRSSIEHGRIEALALHDVGAGADGRRNTHRSPQRTWPNPASGSPRNAAASSALSAGPRLVRPAIAPNRGGAIGSAPDARSTRGRDRSRAGCRRRTQGEVANRVGVDDLDVAPPGTPTRPSDSDPLPEHGDGRLVERRLLVHGCEVTHTGARFSAKARGPRALSGCAR